MANVFSVVAFLHKHIKPSQHSYSINWVLYISVKKHRFLPCISSQYQIFCSYIIRPFPGILIPWHIRPRPQTLFFRLEISIFKYKDQYVGPDGILVCSFGAGWKIPALNCREKTVFSAELTIWKFAKTPALRKSIKPAHPSLLFYGIIIRHKQMHCKNGPGFLYERADFFTFFI